MYFKDIYTIDLSKIIKKPDSIWAHIDNKGVETLYEHCELVKLYFTRLIKQKKLDNVFNKIEKLQTEGLSDSGRRLYKEMLLNIIYLHDIGKINSIFQSKKMNNVLLNNKKANRLNYSNHSMLSSIIYINHYFKIIKDYGEEEDQNKLFTLLILNSYIISKHHGGLDSIDDYFEKLIDKDGEGYKLLGERKIVYEDLYIEEFILNHDYLKILVDGSKHVLAKESNSTLNYVYIRLISSLLVASDYYATSHFMNKGEMLTQGTIDDISLFYNEFKKTDVFKWIRSYEIEKYGQVIDFSNIDNINILRNELFLDAERTLLNNQDRSIFYLEAPTGSGKSNVAFNLSFKLLEKNKSLNKIFYVYPFNTLIEQNTETLGKMFKDKDVMDNIAVINSIVPIKHDRRYEKDKIEISDVSDKGYEKSLLNRQFLQYPIILTTHISLFNFLFGTSKDNIFPLFQIANSVLVLDEIQSYKNKIWKEIITFLNNYADMLNIKIIIMSATLPNLDKLFEGELNSVNLIHRREKYFGNKIFKNRVKVDFSLLNSDDIEVELLNHVLKNSRESKKNILIEFISKKSAMKFYEEIKAFNNLGSRRIELITGDDNSIERNRIIGMIKNKKELQEGMILVATQVIEAGVDIDMDIGYKDISMLDSEEQFIGRINRSSINKDGGIVYFFDLDDAGGIYKGDIRKEKQISIRNEEFQDIFVNKNFEDFYKHVFVYLEKEAKRLSESSYSSFMKEKVSMLDFTGVKERMNLIDNRFEYTVFLNRTLEIGNGETLIGSQVWEEYISVLMDRDMGYAERKIKISEVTSKMAFFIYKVNNNNFTFNDQIGDIYYIEDSDVYFNGGKFNRDMFNNHWGGFI